MNITTVPHTDLSQSSNRKFAKWPKWFVFSSSVIFLVTGLAKIISAFGTAKVLNVADPIFGVRFKHVMLFVGAFELLIITICMFNARVILNVVLIAWTATMFLFYRLGLVWLGYQGPCSCLGNLTDSLHISKNTAETMLKIILTYLLIGSYIALGWFWSLRRNSFEKNDLKFENKPELDF